MVTVDLLNTGLPQTFSLFLKKKTTTWYLQSAMKRDVPVVADTHSDGTAICTSVKKIFHSFLFPSASFKPGCPVFNL